MSLLKSRVAKLEQVLEAQQPPRLIVVRKRSDEPKREAYARAGIDIDNPPPNTRVLVIEREIVK